MSEISDTERVEILLDAMKDIGKEVVGNMAESTKLAINFNYQHYKRIYMLFGITWVLILLSWIFST